VTFAVALLAFGLALYSQRGAVLTAAGNYLVRVDPLEAAEIIVVLAGDGAGNRIMKAVELVRHDFAPTILVDGPMGHYGHYESELAIDFAVAKGAPEEIFDALPMYASSTLEEADVVCAELRRRKLRRAILVTSNFHTRRAGEIFREAAGEDIQFIVSSASDSIFEPDQWWKTRMGKKIFVQEAMKTVNSWME
jgi:uncharacterized SAM-binding protein YcdF (DUF218 family)